MILILRYSVYLLVVCIVIQGKRISETKCSEYRELSLKKAVINPLTANSRPVVIKSFDCNKIMDLIVGGEAAKPGEFPHQALLGYSNLRGGYTFDCGGSLISERFVLTAAHCFAPGLPKIIRLAEHSLQDEYDNQIDYDVKQSYRHPEHRYNRSYNDIALIKLDQDVRFSKFIRPACLWTELTINLSSVIATGFGIIAHADHRADTLQKVILDFLDREQCDEQFRKFRKFSQGVLDSQLCIGSIEGGKSTCQGDAGGPVQVIMDPRGCTYHILGITSMGSACGIGQSPGIYTRVSSYIDWIENVVWGSISTDD